MAKHRYDMPDFEWSVIQPLLPNKSRGVPRVDDRRVLNGIFWRLRKARHGQISLALRSPYTLREPVQSVASCWGLGQVFIRAVSAAYDGDLLCVHA